VRKLFRYSGLGVFFSAIFTFIQGCTQTEGLGLALLLLLLMLTGQSGELAINGTGSGTVVASTAINIDCTLSNGTASGTCSDAVQLGSTQILNATPASGFILDSWTNCSNPSGNVCNHAMTEDVTITANFVQTFTLTVLFNSVFNPPVGVTSDIGGINCNATSGIIGTGSGTGVCAASFPAGTVVELTSTGIIWNRWTNTSLVSCFTGAGSASRTINVTMDADRSCTAAYIP